MNGRLAAAFAVLLVVATGSGASAQTWPTKPVRVVLGFAPGGPTDTLARTVAEYLSQVIGQPAVVENKPGAASNLAAETVAKSPPDGHTLFVGGMGPYSINVALYSTLPYDPDRELAPITVLARVPVVLAVNPTLPVHSLKELVEYAKKNPGTVNYSSPGVGTSPHLFAEMFRMKGEFESTHAPYRSGPLTLNAAIQGEVQWTIDAPLTAVPAHRNGKIRILAITSDGRWPAYPDIPTMAEQGFPEVTAYAWFALSAPGGTPKPIIDRLNAEVTRGLATEQVKQRLASLGFEPAPMSPSETARYFAKERARWTPVIKANNIRAD